VKSVPIFTKINKVAPVKSNGFKKGKYIHRVPPGSRIDFIDFFLFERFEQMDHQGMAGFDPHVFRVNANYLDPTALVQAEKDKTPKLISAN